MQINGIASGDLLAGAAGAARLRWLAAFAVEGLGHDPGQGGLASAAHAAENQGVRHPAAQQGVLEGADNVLLADNLGEILRPGFAGKDEVGQGGSGDRKILINRHLADVLSLKCVFPSAPS